MHVVADVDAPSPAEVCRIVDAGMVCNRDPLGTIELALVADFHVAPDPRKSPALATASSDRNAIYSPPATGNQIGKLRLRHRSN